MKDVTTDLEYFGDQFILTRVTAVVSATLCNNTKFHPRGAGSNKYEDGVLQNYRSQKTLKMYVPHLHQVHLVVWIV